MKPEIVFGLKSPLLPFSREGILVSEVWNRKQDTDVSISLVVLPPKQQSNPHALTIDERYLIVRGRGLAHIGELEPTKVGPGDLIFIPAGTTQWIENIWSIDLEFYCICTPRFGPQHYQDR